MATSSSDIVLFFIISSAWSALLTESLTPYIISMEERVANMLMIEMTRVT